MTPPPEPKAGSRAAEPNLVYLACVGGAEPLRTHRSTGLETGQCARSLVVDDLAAVVVDVPVGMFVGPDAETRLGDLAWIAPRAEAHERIVRAARDRGPILPAQFGAVFSSAEPIRSLLRDRGPEIRAFLADAAGHTEVSVKVLVEKRGATPVPVSSDAVDGAATGADYLMRKRSQRDADAIRQAAVDAHIDEAAAILEPHCSDAEECRGVEAGDTSDTVARSWAFWVPNDHLGAFRDAVDRLTAMHRSAGIRYVLGGPWPPYTFAPKLSA